MAMITQSEYGRVTVDDKVIVSLIIDEMLDMDGELTPVSKKGRLLGKGIFSSYAGLYQSVEMKELELNGMTHSLVEVYFAIMFGKDNDQVANTLFDRIEEIFDMFCLDKPVEIVAHIKGTLTNVGLSDKDKKQQLIEHDAEITRHNE